MNVAQAMCASSGGGHAPTGFDWFKWARPVSRPPVHIVKARRVILALTGPVHAGLPNGLSRMKGKLSCPVLRGGGSGNAAPLPDHAQKHRATEPRRALPQSASD